MNFKNWILCLFCIFIPLANVYACNFTINVDNTMTDPATSLVWQIDESGNGDWYFAMKGAKQNRYLGYSDWRLPNNDELKRFIDSRCWKSKQKYYWSATTNEPNGFIAYMERGRLSDAHGMIGSSPSTLFVRGGQPADQAEFDRQYNTKILPILKKEASDREAEIKAKKEAAIADAAYKQRVATEEKQLQSILNGKNPQAMYLAAGTYNRNGDSSKARAIYEAIISRFSSSNWAVKSSDQLSATKRSNDAESAANQRQYDQQRANEDASRKSRSDCSYRINKCEDSCGYGNGRFQCTQGCKSICNQF